MRFSDRITFVLIEESKYNPSTGSYDKSEPIKTIVPCKLQPLSVKRRAELFGNVNKQTTVAIFRRPYARPFTHIEYNGKEYKDIQSSTHKKSAIYIAGDLIGQN